MKTNTNQRTQSNTPGPGSRGLALSIALGSVLLGAFVPLFLVPAGCAIVWLFVRCNRLSSSPDRAPGSEFATGETDTRLGRLIDAADIPIVGTNEHGLITNRNRQAQDVLGIGELMIGRRFDEIMPQVALHELESLARSREPGHARLSISVDGEMRDFDVSADPFETSEIIEHTQSSQSSGAVLIFRDITELSRAMSLHADFVANASHELRTPIASIKEASETLSGSGKHDEQMSARLIEVITSNAMHLELLAIDLLDLSKLENESQPPAIGPVDIIELIDRAISEHRSIASRRNLRFAIEQDEQVGDQLKEIQSDPAMLVLILRNLIDNATKFAHEDSCIRIGLRRAPIAPDRTATIPDGLDLEMGIELQVIDKGVGIPIDQQQRVFERFYQVNDAPGGSGTIRGTGLGLAIVKHAARRLGGRVSIESVDQVGTTVRVELPRCADA